MEEMPLFEEFKKLQTMKSKGTKTEELNNAGKSNASASSSRRTRSQIAPDWSVQDSLTLVNEVSAMERECGAAVSTFQKWTYVAENLTAMDVVRNVNQCRRKWDSLLKEYKAIKGWERKSKGNGYWLLDAQKRTRNGLPLDFDPEVFGVMDDFVKIRDKRAGSDPDSDVDAEVEVLNAKKSGSKKPQQHRHADRVAMKVEEEDVVVKTKSCKKKPPHQSTSPKGIRNKHTLIEEEEERKPASTEAKIGSKKKASHGQCAPRKGRNNMKAANDRLITEDIAPAEIPKKARGRSIAFERSNDEEGNGHPATGKNKNSKIGGEEKKQLLADRVRENSELIKAILAGNVCQDDNDEEDDDDNKSTDDPKYLRMRLARRKADKLIPCLTELAKSLNLLESEVERKS